MQDRNTSPARGALRGIIRTSLPARAVRNRDIVSTRASAPLDAFDLQRLRAAVKPFRLHWFPRLRSTNDHAAVLRKRGRLFAPALILTGCQTAGRGRGAHTWWSGRGSLTVTFVLPIDEQIAPHQLPLLAGLAVRDAAAELSGDDGIDLKWPNDLLYGGRKVGGLLCERIHKADLVGLGLNVNLPGQAIDRGLRQQAHWLSEIHGGRLDLTEALATVTRHLRRTLARGAEEPFAGLLREYDAHHALIGRRVTVLGEHENSPISGRCEGLDSTGRLLIRDRDKTHRVISGRVLLR